MEQSTTKQLLLEQYFEYATQSREVGIVPSSFASFRDYHQSALAEINEIVRQITRQTS
jgi:hypothetical protein